MATTRTQVGIIGAGPAGLLLAQLLDKAGISSVILERRDRAYVEGRIRAGVLEQGTVDLLNEAGVGERCAREGLVHKGCYISIEDERFEINFEELTGGKHVVVYGQTEVTKDLIHARLAGGGDLRFDCENVAIHDIESDKPRLSYMSAGGPHEVVCDFIAGCDGFHGVARQAMPASLLRVYERVYPFGWLGILAEAPPVMDELIYARHPRGFALYSMRSPKVVRHYIQCLPDTDPEDWPDDRVWDELRLRLPKGDQDKLVTGRVFEKSVTPMRSFVAEPMRFGRMFLAGDAAHIVPPTGAKGLNLAASDEHYLRNALVSYYKTNSSEGLDGYSTQALARIWKAQRFSWWMTSMLHNFGPQDDFDSRVRGAELAYVLSSRAGQTSLAENYVGLPF
ncbi:MAG: 4-hydroxybenzoate 3-monooxygenase [Hyphomicrobiales bacterium]|nr:4-hydroxybenzoate 3-monooxygenase [Hyphomicrobiales bacterium]